MSEKVKVFWDIMLRQLVHSYISKALCCFKMSVNPYPANMENMVS